jgi:hypothetical protein
MLEVLGGLGLVPCGLAVPAQPVKNLARTSTPAKATVTANECRRRAKETADFPDEKKAMPGFKRLSSLGKVYRLGTIILY